jgi:hypothetical protein
MADSNRAAFYEKIGLFTGGKWVGESVGEDGKPRVEWTYEWSADKRILKGEGVIYGAECESRIGWDPDEERGYYIDIHGPETVYLGYMALEGQEIVSDFESVVGPPGVFRSRGRFADPDTYTARLQEVQDGIAVDKHDLKLKRVK